MFVVFDLDGTMCDGSHKIELLKHPEKAGDPWPEQDFAAWTEACIDDVPIEPILSVAQAMVQTGHRVEFWTGRGEDAREVTERWIAKHGHIAGLPVRMRPVHEPNTPDFMVKAQYLIDYGKPDLIFEDKGSVVDMWRAHGILCAQVAPSDH